MEYSLIYSKIATAGLKKLRLSEPKAYKKAKLLIEELKIHPKTGLGQPEELKGNLSGQWSRRISRKHRLVYSIQEQQITVLILTSYAHYNDN